MVSMPRKPFGWGDDLEDIDPAPQTDPYAKVPALERDRMPRGDAPDPATYAKQGEMAGQLLSDPHDPTGDFQASGMMYDLGQQLAFHRGGLLDAQVRYGGSPAYANYAYGVYNAARGADLGDVLDLANLYGKLFSKYPKDKAMDQTYKSIPADNVRNITKGFNDYRGGWVRPAR